METNAIHCRAQVHDVLLAMLRANRAPTVEHLLSLAPPEPLGPPEGNMMVQQKGVGWIGGERKRWPKSVIKLSEKYPGYQPGYEYRADSA